MPISSSPRTADARATPRASIYLAAALYCDGTSSPVKIRNISDTGALLEGDLIPAAGALVQLVRGGLIAHGLVAWSEEQRCGLRFSGRVDVQLWRATNIEQQRVDEVVRLVKAGAVPLPVSPLGEPKPLPAQGRGALLAGDLRRVAELLDNLGGELAIDPDVVSRHGPMLQHLDIAMQVLAAVEEIVAGHEGDAAKLAGLRRSADQALQRGALGD